MAAAKTRKSSFKKSGEDIEQKLNAESETPAQEPAPVSDSAPAAEDTDRNQKKGTTTKSKKSADNEVTITLPNNISDKEGEEFVMMGFRVTKEERRRAKAYALNHGTSTVELVRKFFQSLDA